MRVIVALLWAAAGLLLVPGQAWAQCISITNSISIILSSGIGIDGGFGNCSTVTNTNSGVISVISPTGIDPAIGIRGTVIDVTNYGIITASGHAGAGSSGILIQQYFSVGSTNSTVTNYGTISAPGTIIPYNNGNNAIQFAGSSSAPAVTILNYGTISSASGAAIASTGSSDGILNITNYNTGIIFTGASGYPAILGIPANVTNYGTIIGGVQSSGGGTSTIINYGTISGPVNGTNFTQTTTGNLTLRVNSSSIDAVSLTGTATLAGTLTAAAASSTFKAKYTLLTALGGVNGTFSSLVTSGSWGSLSPILSYDANNVYLITSLSQSLPANTNDNQRGVLRGIDNALNNGATLSSGFNTLFGLTGSAYTNALTQISGAAGAGGGTQAGMHMMGSFLTLALNPFGGSPGGNTGSVGIGRGFAAEQELPPEVAAAYAAVTPSDRRPSSTFDRRWGIWGQAYGGLNKTSGDTNTGTHDTTARSYGFATGADYRVSADTMVGFALAGGGMNYGLSDGLGGGKSDVFQMGVYGSKKFGPAYISAALSYAWHGMKTDRTVTISGTDNLTASFNAQSFGGRLESGYRFDVPFVSITPYAALQIQHFRTPSYSESATSGSNTFALSYDAKSTTSTRTELGAWFDKMIALDRGNMLAVRTRAAWAHDLSSDESVSAAFQSLPGSSFTTNGAATVPNSALLSAGAEIRLASGLSFGAKFDGEFASRSQTYAGTGTVRYVW